MRSKEENGNPKLNEEWQETIEIQKKQPALISIGIHSIS